MSTVQHHTVIATTWDQQSYLNVRKWILALHHSEGYLFIFNSHSLVNEAHTIVLTPDGSNEGWPDSDQGDDLRTRFIEHIKTLYNTDGSNPFDYIEVSYGDLGAELLRSNTVEDEQ